MILVDVYFTLFRQNNHLRYFKYLWCNLNRPLGKLSLCLWIKHLRMCCSVCVAAYC